MVDLRIKRNVVHDRRQPRATEGDRSGVFDGGRARDARRIQTPAVREGVGLVVELMEPGAGLLGVGTGLEMPKTGSITVLMACLDIWWPVTTHLEHVLPLSAHKIRHRIRDDRLVGVGKSPGKAAVVELIGRLDLSPPSRPLSQAHTSPSHVATPPPLPLGWMFSL